MRRSILKLSLYTAFGVACIGPSLAQSTPMSDIPGGKNVTCREFLRLDMATATKVLYFANGYAAGVEDQISAGTPSAVAAANAETDRKATGKPASPPPASNDLSSLATMSMDQLRSVCQASPQATVLSSIPGGSPVSGSGTITGSSADAATGTGAAASTGKTTGQTPAADSGGLGASGAVTDTTGAAAGAAGGANSAGAAASEIKSAPTAVTTPGSTRTDPSNGLVTAVPGSTSLGGGAAGSVGGGAAGSTSGAAGTAQ